ncbi:hypothetical protein [Jiangella rhizosphaerae]|uniref:Uncharacterized protein n=1 Tax=Jiangella rhizosphaerae TaxID=2293569 RepID=A0A418KQ35_9ACTN|nr:hypothetical protein [Jiangella rhizosphaerae]RIQ21634.1 hypothetical protein DY240_14800 [Jiangella rhizosphaerae]
MDEDEELLQEAIRRVMTRENRRLSEETTDEHGNPLPRLDLDHPPATTDDPLLRVGYALLPHLPTGWLTAILNVAAAADDVRTWVMITKPGEGLSQYEHLHYLPDVAEAAASLRHATYEPERGAWYGFILRLNANGTLVLREDYESPPFLHWGPREVELVRRDQVLYPRPPERLPAWHPAR